MNTDLTNFRAWYAQILEKLYPDPNAGIAVLMLSMPLLERYLRNKALRAERRLNSAWYEELRAVFPVLTSAEMAEQFWGVYRNGFLHQATLSLRTRSGDPLPAGELTHGITVPILVTTDGNFVLQPILFSKKVIATIETDFATFVAAGTESPQLSRVITRGSNYGTVDNAAGTQQNTYMGTGNRS